MKFFSQWKVFIGFSILFVWIFLFYSGLVKQTTFEQTNIWGLGILVTLFMFIISSYITYHVFQYRSSSEEFDHMVGSIEQLAIYVSLIPATLSCTTHKDLREYIISLPNKIFKILTCEFNGKELPNSPKQAICNYTTSYTAIIKTGLNLIEKMRLYLEFEVYSKKEKEFVDKSKTYQLMIVKAIQSSMVKKIGEDVRDIKRTFEAVNNGIIKMRAIHAAKNPSVIYLILIVLALSIQIIGIPFVLSYYHLIYGSIFSILCGFVMFYLIDFPKTIVPFLMEETEGYKAAKIRIEEAKQACEKILTESLLPLDTILKME